MKYLRQENAICFTLQEIKQIYKRTKLRQIQEVLAVKGESFEQAILEQGQVLQEAVNEIIAKGLKDTDEVEVFMATTLAFRYFKEGDTHVCFILKNGTKLSTIDVSTLDLGGLKKIMQKDDSTDFVINTGKSWHFQHKQCKESLETIPVFEFIKRELKGYGNNLGQVNLFVTLQYPRNVDPASGMQTSNIDFAHLHRLIKELNLNQAGEILVSYNEANKYAVLWKVYPELEEGKVSLELPSASWD